MTKEDGTPISSQDLFDIEVHHRVPAPHVLGKLARVLTLDDDTLVRDYLQEHPRTPRR
jgi:hypothetical protein